MYWNGLTDWTKLMVLKRFEYRHGRHDRAASKVSNEVRFPLQLNMLPYTNRARSRDSRENFELERSCTYDLLSVVVHVGEIDTGHYTSYCRVGDQVGITILPRLFSGVLTCGISGSSSMTTRLRWLVCLMYSALRPICSSTSSAPSPNPVLQ